MKRSYLGDVGAGMTLSGRLDVGGTMIVLARDMEMDAERNTRQSHAYTLRSEATHEEN